MFMPFGLEPDLPGDSTPYNDVLNDYVQSVNYKFGQLFYRDRVVRHFADGLRLIEAGETEIQRHKDIPKIESWVDNYSKSLRAL